MSSKKKLLMVIPINTSRFNKAAKAYVKPVIAPGFTLDVMSIDSGFDSIQSRYSLERNAEHVTALVEKVGPKYDGVFISDFDGCAADACREILNIPVLDGFGPQASIALTLAQTFSIITPNDTLVGLDIAHPRALGLDDTLVSVRAMDLRMNEMDKLDLVLGHAFEASVLAIQHDGAQAILLGCTAMMGVAQPLAERLASYGLPVPVLDPNLVGVAFLQMLVRCGLSQSALCYPTPPELRLRPPPGYAHQLKPLPRPRMNGAGSA